MARDTGELDPVVVHRSRGHAPTSPSPPSIVRHVSGGQDFYPPASRRAKTRP